MTQKDFFNLWFNNQPLSSRAILNSSAFAMKVTLADVEGVFSWQPQAPAPGDIPYPAAMHLKDGVEDIIFATENLQNFPRLEKALLLAGSIPEEILLAIADAELKAYAPWLGENIRLDHVTAGPNAETLQNTRAFLIRSPEGKILQQGVITMTAGLEERWGTLDNLDIRQYFSENSQPLAARICYAGIRLQEQELAELNPGDRLMLPEWNTEEKSAGCLLIADSRLGARAHQKACTLTVQAPWQPFHTEPDELLITGDEIQLTAVKALEILEDKSQMEIQLLSSDKLFLMKNGVIAAEGLHSVLCGQSCMEITAVPQP